MQLPKTPVYLHACLQVFKRTKVQHFNRVSVLKCPPLVTSPQWNQNVSHITFELALLALQLANCGENTLLA